MKVLRPPDQSNYVPTREAMSHVVNIVTERGLVRGKYLHWDRIFHLQPPEGLTREDWWWGIRLARRAGMRPLPLHGSGDRLLALNFTDTVIEGLHMVDQMASGNIRISDKVTNPSTRDRYVINSLIEEAITSSQLEGASTTRKVAKEMLRTGRPPRDRSERMIVNNYLAMQRVRELVGEPLTRDVICELHRIVTEDTLDDPADAGRIQMPGEDRVGVYSDTDELLYRPMPAEEIPARLEELFAFANSPNAEPFIHPVIRAMAIHFALGFIHPFADGNGRTARALFYWSMLSQGYWLAEFLTISAILRKAPSKYTKSFLYTETDDDDLTYFILYQLDVVKRAIRELHDYLDRKVAEIREAERIAKASGDLNHRQLALISHAIRNPDADYTIQSHRNSHNVVYQTARADLLGLVGKGFLNVNRINRADHFRPPVDLAARLSA